MSSSRMNGMGDGLEPGGRGIAGHTKGLAKKLTCCIVTAMASGVLLIMAIQVSAYRLSLSISLPVCLSFCQSVCVVRGSILFGLSTKSTQRTESTVVFWRSSVCEKFFRYFVQTKEAAS